MHLAIQETIEGLRTIQGLANVHLLSNDEKKIIAQLEDEENDGVHACLAKPFTLVITHDSTFRDPVAPITLKKKNHHIFPPIPFPEVKQKDVISSSPSKKVHDFLVKKFNLDVNDDATLLIGFELHNI